MRTNPPYRETKRFLLAWMAALLILMTSGLVTNAWAAASPYAPVFLRAWGSTGVGTNEFTLPYGIEAGGGSVFVADTYNNRVQVFNLSGGSPTQFGQLGSADGQFDGPHGITRDSSGNLYVADTNNHRIQKFNASGTFLSKWGSSGTTNGQFRYPYDIVYDPIKNVLYVADTFNHRIQKFSTDGGWLDTWGGTRGSGTDQFNYPSGVATDTAGNVYVADTLNNRILKRNESGVFQAVIGSVGAGNGQFNQPRGIAIDADNTLYVADSNNNRIQKLSSTGTYLAQFGSSGSGSGQFSNPYALALAGVDQVYVADTSNDRVQQFEPDRAPSALALNPSSVGEHQPAGTLVGSFTTTDANSRDTFTYALVAGTGDTDNAKFAVSGSTLVTAASLGGQASYAVRVQVTDSGGMTFANGFTISLNNVNDPPSIQAQTLAQVSERATPGTPVGQIAATDPDPGDTLTFLKTGGSDAFNVSSTGEVTVASTALLNYEDPAFPQHNRSMTIEVKDAAGLSASATVTVYVSDANDPPAIQGQSVYNMDENPTSWVDMGAPYTFTDEDPGQTVTWSLVGWNPVWSENAVMLRSPTNPQLFIYDSSKWNYEWIPVIKFTLRATDNGFPAQYTDFPITLNIQDVNEAPYCFWDREINMLENRSVGDLSTTFTIYDPEKNIVKWGLTSGDLGGTFEMVKLGVDPNNSETQFAIKVAKPIDLNYETANTTYNMVLDIQDDAGYTCATRGVTESRLKMNLWNVDEAPYFGDGSVVPNPIFVDEHKAKDTVIADVTAEDPDDWMGYDTGHSFWISAGNEFPPGDPWHGVFYMYYTRVDNKNVGHIAIQFPDMLDYERRSSYNLTISVMDRGNNTASVSNVIVNVNDINEAPVMAAQNFYAKEGSAQGSVIGKVIATDQDQKDVLTYEIVSGDPTQAFSIDASGNLLYNDPAQFTLGKSFTLTVKATDPSGLSASATVTVTVTKGNNPPIIADQSFWLAENSPVGANVVYTVAAIDNDPGNLISYKIIGGTGKDAFAINATNGQLTVKDNTLLNYETALEHQLTLTVEVSDDYNTPATASATVTVNLTDVSEAPVINDQTLNVVENTPVDSVAAKPIFVDDDANESLTFSIDSGNTGGTFKFNTLGELLVANSTLLNYEKLTSPFSLGVTITDKNLMKDTAVLTINVTDANDPPAVKLGTYQVEEGKPNSTVVGSLIVTDEDVPAQVFSYQITSGNTGGAFAIDNNGQITVANTSVIDFETLPSYNLGVKVSDNGTPSGETNVILPVQVLNKNEPPHFSPGSQTFTISDRSPLNTLIGTFPASDPENELVSYSISAGNINNAFDIDGSGKLTVANQDEVDYGLHTSFVLTLQATDPAGLSDNRTVTINLNPRPDLELQVYIPDQILIGSTLTYDVYILNNGYKNSSDYSVQFPIPTGMTFQADTSWGDCVRSGANVVCSEKSLTAHQSLNFPVRFTVNANVEDGSMPQVSGVVTPSGDDMDPSNQQWSTTIAAVKQIVVFASSFEPGDTLPDGFWVDQNNQPPAVTTAPQDGRSFMGAFGSEGITFRADLPDHDYVEVSADVYILHGWKGNDATDGPDQWMLTVTDPLMLGLTESTLLKTTFSNLEGFNQAYPKSYPGGNNPAFTGSSEFNNLGYDTDATYHITYTFSHNNPTLLLNFLAALTNAQGESWGLDNVQVIIKADSTQFLYIPLVRR